MSVSLQVAAPAASHFDTLAETYDSLFTDSLIGKAQRESVWQEMDRIFKPGQRILEINCGTGRDAMHLAQRGVSVVACDASSGMIATAGQRLQLSAFEILVQFRQLATEQIARLAEQGPFDGVLSNFAGINCLQDLDGLAADLERLVAPGGKAVLCLFGRACAWEMLWYLAQGNPRKAFRRLRREGATANLGGVQDFHVTYPSVKTLQRIFSPGFRLKSWKGVGIAVPPSYLEFLARKFNRALSAAVQADRCLSRTPGFRALSDHVVLTFERLATQ